MICGEDLMLIWESEINLGGKTSTPFFSHYENLIANYSISIARAPAAKKVAPKKAAAPKKAVKKAAPAKKAAAPKVAKKAAAKKAAPKKAAAKKAAPAKKAAKKWLLWSPSLE